MKKTNYFMTLLMFMGGVLLISQAEAKVRISDAKLMQKVGNSRKVIVKFTGKMIESPELTVKGSMVQIVVPNAVVWPKIEKRVSVGVGKFDATLLAYQYNKKTTRVRLLLPYSLAGYEDKVSLTLSDNHVELLFPVTGKLVKNAPAITKKKKNEKERVSLEKYDEAYLDELLKDKKKIGATIKSDFNLGKELAKNPKKDSVSTALAAPERSSKGKFSIASYLGKFVAFLGIILVLFYGVTTLLKKGVIKKGKLAFFNNMKAVEVLSKTYLGPKKNLLVVKAHKQVMLIGVDDKGMYFLSELQDAAGIMKEGESSIAGNNFDDNLLSANQVDKSFNIKDDLQEATASGGVSEFIASATTTDRVKLSDQIKNKVKGLKSLQ